MNIFEAVGGTTLTQKREKIMAHEPKIGATPTQRDIERAIAVAHQMRADHMAKMLRAAANSVTGLFRRHRVAADATS